ncbi:MAG: sigma-70 family RNA polymerase sigma factor [Candidatus Hydrogenedentes bacterium]|nr:sigma-70 family RNA polymerase sigma factor [Candidatus Hydrogenedentota bacterium]
MKSLDDKALAFALQAGEEEAFDEIVARFQGRVYAVAYRVLGNREDALDASQEVFLKVYHKIGRWKPTGGFLPWILRMTTNHSIDQLRKKRRHPHQSLEEAFVPTSEGAAVEPSTMQTDTAVRGREIEERIRAALPVLSPSQREVFLLRHYEGFPLAEIAESMGCTVGSVKVHLFRALKKLQKELRDLYEVA